ncbi:hypothetical protein [Kitasatospora sp. CB02891]|uniref:hypothetical protein n=1 Tax=Kitasatospora sp. CB02891 TaxID=2020329 RepID=UPI000C26DBD8|nr:hypothetical protein [Kitasatospora sp. CB02891]PJN21129.1 hypothetical protein CG736_34880 [Kitasatospora sp. CB02891]
MPQIRLMGSNPSSVRETAEAMVRALRASSELQVGDVSEVPNRRGPGLRVYVELLLREPGPEQQVTVTVEREDRPGPGRRTQVRTRQAALPPAPPR